MRMKIKSISVVCLLILNLLIVSWNIGFSATKLDEKMNSRSIQFTPDDYYWEPVQVISEPILNNDNNTAASIEPKIAVENDKIYVVWQDENNTNGAGTDYDIFYRYFNGSAWSDIQVISEPVPGKNRNTEKSSSPDIAVSNGNIYVVWEDNNNTDNAKITDSDIFYRCNISGSGWEPVQVISEPEVGSDWNNGDSYNPEIAVENDKIYVVWYDETNFNGAGTNADIFFLYNETGSTWEPVQVISEPVKGQDFHSGLAYDPDLAVENDKIYVVWMSTNDTNGVGTDLDIFYKCNLTGTGWESVQVISEPTLAGNTVNDQESAKPDIAVENGKIFVVWHDRTDFNGGGTDREIFYRCNLTSSWEDIQVISEPVLGTNTNLDRSDDPDIVVKNSNIYVVWEDESGIGSSGLDDDIYIRNNLTGSSWEDIQVVSEPVENYIANTANSRDPSMGVDNGIMHIVWRDTNLTNGAGTDNDIFYRNSIFKPILLGEVTPKIGNTSTIFNYTVSYKHVENKTPSFIRIKIDDNEYSMLAADPGDTNYIDGKIYYFETKLDIGNDHTFHFSTSDNITLIKTTIFKGPEVVNTAPNITTTDNTTAFEDSKYEVNYEYDDIDVTNVGQAVYWLMDTNASWLYWDLKNSILYGTPSIDDIGQYWVNVSISDTLSTNQTSFTITVKAVNDPPVLINDALANALEDTTYEVQFEGEDEESTKLSWDITTNASWLNVNNNLGKINGIPKNVDVGGDFWVNVTVDDGQLNDNKNFSLEVINTNDPPLIITEDVINATVDEIYYIDYEATDVDIGDTLTWALKTDAKEWLTINSTTGELNGTPIERDIGKYFVQVSVVDNHGGRDLHAFILTVKSKINEPPEIITDDKLSVIKNETYSVDYEATDDRTPIPNLQWYLDTNATWLSIDSKTGILSGTPKIEDIGLYRVNVSVSDGEKGWDYHSFILTVTKEPQSGPNKKPELNNGKVTPKSGDTDKEFTFSVIYTDEDNDPGDVWVWIDGNKHKMNPDPKNDNYSDGVEYTYKTKLDEGEHNYYFSANDGTDDAEAGDDTPITASDAKSTSKVTRTEEDFIIYIIFIIIIFIVAILAFIIGRRSAPKPPVEREEQRFEEDEFEEEDRLVEEPEDEPEEESLKEEEIIDEEPIEEEPEDSELEEEELEDEDLDEEELEE